MDDDHDPTLEEVELRRIRAQVDMLPPGPWEAVELTDHDLQGPLPWDPDVQPSRDAHERAEKLRREHTAWRGVRAADGTLVAGEPVRGGTPRPVIDPAWIFLADARTHIPRLLATLRPLWRLRREHAPEPTDPEPRRGRADDHHAVVVDVEKAAMAAYEAVPSPTRWNSLPELLRDEWRARAAAALAAAGVDGPDG